MWHGSEMKWQCCWRGSDVDVGVAMIWNGSDVEWKFMWSGIGVE